MAEGDLTHDECSRVAQQATERAFGVRGSVVGLSDTQIGHSFIVDGRYRVTVVARTGDILQARDRDWYEGPHVAHRIEAQPSSAEIDEAGLEILRSVFPDFDTSEFRLKWAMVSREHARVEAIWDRIISGSGFPGPGRCRVDFCWPDRAIFEICAYSLPIDDSWRRPASVTEDQAASLARGGLGDLTGCWLKTTRSLCIVDPSDWFASRPAWETIVMFGSPDAPNESYPLRAAYVDPWSGEMFLIQKFRSAAPSPEAMPHEDPHSGAPEDQAMQDTYGSRPIDSGKKRALAMPDVGAGGGAPAGAELPVSPGVAPATSTEPPSRVALWVGAAVLGVNGGAVLLWRRRAANEGHSS